MRNQNKAAGVVTYSTSGTALGFFPTPNAPSPFGILDHQGGLLVTSSSANDDIHKYTYAGVASGTFHNSASLAFVEQMVHATNGDVLAANFTTGGVARLNPTTGAVISSFTAGGQHAGNDERTRNLLWRLALLHYNDGSWRRSHPVVRRLEGYTRAQQALNTPQP